MIFGHISGDTEMNILVCPKYPQVSECVWKLQFIYVAYITTQVVLRRFTETKSMKLLLTFKTLFCNMSSVLILQPAMAE